MTANTGWLRPPDPAADARHRLLLFHYSGGGVSMYAQWPGYLPDEIGVQRVQLPGRQDRATEPPFVHLEPLLDALVDVLDAADDDRPFTLFGHSMGALVAYRLAVALRQAARPEPALLAVAGWTPVGFAELAPDLLTGDGERIVEELRRLGSLPGAHLTEDEIRTLVVPPMRADLAVCASYVDDHAVVGCPVAVYHGRQDPLVARGGMNAWATRTERHLGVRTYPGGHFFIHEHGAAIAADLAGLMTTHINSSTHR